MYGAIKTTKDARKVIFAIVLASILPMLIGYYQFLTGTGYKTFMGMTNRPTGGLGWPNMYGIFLAISFCAGLMLLLQQNTPFRRIFLTSVIASMAVSSIIALNRGTWVALSAALLFALPLYRQEIRVRWFILAGILIAIIFSGVIVERFMQLEEITPMGQTRNTLATRIENWRANLSLVPRHPLIGFGIGTAQLVAEKFHKTSLVPHNDYLRLLVEMGILGPLLYILFLLRELHRNVRQSFDKRNWFINYPTLVAVIYWIIISFTQNVVHSVISFPMFLSLVAVSRRWNELTHSFGHPLA
jgi:O-antigen ligase